MNASYVGLAISQSLILSGMLQFGMMQTSQLVSQMTCVERILEYTNLKKETSKASGKYKIHIIATKNGYSFFD